MEICVVLCFLGSSGHCADLHINGLGLLFHRSVMKFHSKCDTRLARKKNSLSILSHLIENLFNLRARISFRFDFHRDYVHSMTWRFCSVLFWSYRTISLFHAAVICQMLYLDSLFAELQMKVYELVALANGQKNRQHHAHISDYKLAVLGTQASKKKGNDEKRIAILTTGPPEKRNKMSTKYNRICWFVYM